MSWPKIIITSSMTWLYLLIFVFIFIFKFTFTFIFMLIFIFVFIYHYLRSILFLTCLKFHSNKMSSHSIKTFYNNCYSEEMNTYCVDRQERIQTFNVFKCLSGPHCDLCLHFTYIMKSWNASQISQYGHNNVKLEWWSVMLKREWKRGGVEKDWQAGVQMKGRKGGREKESEWVSEWGRKRRREGGSLRGDGYVMIWCSNRSPLVTGLKGPEERVKGGDMKISQSR